MRMGSCIRRAPVGKNLPKWMIESKGDVSKGATKADVFQSTWRRDGLKDVETGWRLAVDLTFYVTSSEIKNSQKLQRHITCVSCKTME